MADKKAFRMGHMRLNIAGHQRGCGRRNGDIFCKDVFKFEQEPMFDL